MVRKIFFQNSLIRFSTLALTTALSKESETSSTISTATTTKPAGVKRNHEATRAMSVTAMEKPKVRSSTGGAYPDEAGAPDPPSTDAAPGRGGAARGEVEQPPDQLLAAHHAGRRGDVQAGGGPVLVGELALRRTDGVVGHGEQLGVEQGVAGGDQVVGAGAAHHLAGGGRLGQRPRHAVDLAALHRDAPAALGAPVRQLRHPVHRQLGAVDHAVDEQVGRRAQLLDEVAAPLLHVRADLLDLGAAVERALDDPVPVLVRDAVDEQVAAVAGDRVPRRAADAGQVDPSELLGGAGGRRDERGGGRELGQQVPGALGDERDGVAVQHLDRGQARAPRGRARAAAAPGGSR